MEEHTKGGMAKFSPKDQLSKGPTRGLIKQEKMANGKQK